MSSFQLSSFADEADASLKGQIEAMERHGVYLIEMRGVDGKNVSELTNEEADDARKRLEDHGMTLSSMGSPYGKYPIDQPFAAHMDSFRRGLEICRHLNAKRIRMFSFFMPKGGSPADWTNKVLDQLDEMLRAAEDAGIELYHENEKGIYGDVTERCLEILTAFKGRLGGIFDPANFIQCGVRPEEAMPVLKPYINYMHIKDAMLEDGAVVPAGCGDGHVSELLEALSDKADHMILTVEPHLTVFEGLNKLQDEKVEHKYHYESRPAAYAAAVNALKGILTQLHYTEGGNGVWTR